MKASMTITINFDLDGTIVNLYGMDNWLECLRNYDPTPYIVAEPLIRLSALARRLNTLQKKGYEIAVISWLSKESIAEYDEMVAQAKREWLAKHLPSVVWDRITIVPYGTPKESFCGSPLDILFDDEEKNRMNWTGRAFDVDCIFETLATLQGSRLCPRRTQAAANPY